MSQRKHEHEHEVERMSEAEREEHTDAVLLAMLLDGDAQRPWTVAEIARELDLPEEAADSLGRLARAGLIHRLDGFVVRLARRDPRKHALKPTLRAPLMSEAPSPELLLAAIERAETHRNLRVVGVAFVTLLEHLDIPRRSHQARPIRAQLDVLAEEGALERARPQRGIDTWTLTRAGRRRLAKARRAGANLALPESPQHRKWRNARTLAEAEIDRFRRQLRDALQDAQALLDTEPPPTDSDAWLAMGKQLQRATWRLASTTHCLYEWQEPQEDQPDILDPRRHPGLRYIPSPP